VTEDWIKKKDSDALDVAVAKICANRVLIKHCVEMVPWPVTEALAREAVRRGYRHVFLYRRNAIDRLLSLHFARVTGVWGPNRKAQTPNRPSQGDNESSVKDNAISQPLPVEALTKHEERCVQVLSDAWALLRSLNADSWSLAYEDLFVGANVARATKILVPLLCYLGVRRTDEEDQVWVSELLTTGDQKTRLHYRQLPGVPELQNRLAAQRGFSPTPRAMKIQAALKGDPPDWLLRGVVDTAPGQAEFGRSFEIGGVMVLGKGAPNSISLVCESCVGSARVEWGLPSQRMSKEYPQATNGMTARFRVADLLLTSPDDRISLVLSTPAGSRWTIAEIRPDLR
jgi:hypothetical protein